MKPFDQALIRLTGLYVAILMMLALVASVWLYTIAAREVQYVLSNPGVQTSEQGSGMVSAETSAEPRILKDLVFFNLFVLGAGTLASYGLAKRTLQPVKKSYEAQAQFAADASHELRTPLTTLKTELQLVRRKPDATITEYDQALDSSLEEIDRLSSMLARLLRLSRPGLKHASSRASIPETLRIVQDRLQPILQAKALHLNTTKYTPASAAIDQHDLAEVLTILLDNAIRFSPKAAAIEVEAREQGRSLLLTIRDHGPGIKETDLTKVFERFYRGTQPADDTHAGYGLGLAVAKKIINHAGGSITAKNVKPGAMFIVRLPLA